MTPYIFGIAGSAGEGKRRLIEHLLPELARRGHRVGLMETEQLLHGSVPPVDVELVLAEGGTGAQWPKLEVYGSSLELALARDPWLVAVVGPTRPRGCLAPWYHWDEVRQIADVIEQARLLSLHLRERAPSRIDR